MLLLLLLRTDWDSVLRLATTAFVRNELGAGSTVGLDECPPLLLVVATTRSGGLGRGLSGGPPDGIPSAANMLFLLLLLLAPLGMDAALTESPLGRNKLGAISTVGGMNLTSLLLLLLLPLPQATLDSDAALSARLIGWNKLGTVQLMN